MNLIERMYQLVDEIRDGRTHARFCQMQKKTALTKAEREEWIRLGGETDDDVDTLVREFRATDRHCEFILKDIEAPEARLSAQVEEARRRINGRVEVA